MLFLTTGSSKRSATPSWLYFRDGFDEGKDPFEKQFRIGFDILMENDFSLMIEDADIHFSGMKIGTAVILMQLIVKFLGMASFG